MFRSPLLCALCLTAWAAWTGCSRKGPPSAEYAQAQALFSSIYAEKLEGAYLDPRLAEVEDLLKAVAPNSVDGESAQALLKQVSEGRAKAAKDDADRQAAIESALKPPAGSFSTGSTRAPPPPPPPELPDAGVDAGYPHPAAGMSLAEFRRRFSDCFEPGSKVAVNGPQLRATWALSGLSRCRDQHPGFDQQLVIEGDGQILGIAPKSSMRQVPLLPDGGLGSP